LNSKKEKALINKRSIQIDINFLNDRLISMSKKAQEIKDAAKLWETINQKNRQRDGLKIDDAKKFVNS